MNPQAIGQLVLAHDFTLDAAVAQVTIEQVDRAIASYEAAERPMSVSDPAYARPKDRSAKTTEISRALQLIGAKVAPTMNDDKATMWRDALLVSLSKWPANAVLWAAQQGTQEPFKFLGDVDAKLHELAERAVDRGVVRLRRLRKMRAEIERAANPLPALPAPPPITPALLAGLARGTTGRMVLKLGLTAGHVEQAEYDAAMKNAPVDIEGLAMPEYNEHVGATEGNPEN